MRNPLFLIVVFAAITVVTATQAHDEGVVRASSTPPEGMETLVARIAPDGKPVLACVDSAEAAKKFLEAPIEKVARGAKEK